jgi:cytochrome c oxidase subunit 1
MPILSTDHKVIGLRYALTSLAFLLVGFLLILLVRWHLAWPTSPIPIVGALLGEDQARNGIITPEFFPQLGAMHGTIMVFLGVVPLAVGAFGNYLVPLMVGASDLAFPRLNLLSYWLYLTGGLVMLAGFLLPGGAAASGWTSYPPLANFATSGQTAWLLGLLFIGTSSILGSTNLIVTILQLRAPGMTMMRLPFFVWTQLVTSFLLLLAFPPLQAAALLQLMDRLAGTSFFLPSGLVVSGRAIAATGGGSPLLWQHLFWFLAHPEVYVLILPALGIVAEVVANTTRRPLWGYRAMVGAALFMGVMSFLVWAHHMFLTGMGPTMSTFFQVTTMIISVPSVVIVSALLLSLYGGSIRFSVPGMFALAFLPMFGIGGLTGLPLGLAASDIPLHDTNYVVGHFHYVVAPGTLFALFAGIYYWFPKVTGRRMSEALGRVHFWGTLLAMNGIFMPMLVQGLAGMNRRLYDGGRSYAQFAGFEKLFALQAWSALALGVVQVVFVVNLVRSVRRGERTSDNPWEATTLEWTTSSPPPRHNFEQTPTVHRGAYDYSVTGAAADYVPQSQP